MSSAKYLLALGTTPGYYVVASKELPYSASSHCLDGLQLQHKRVYYSSVTAFNGGLVLRNVTGFSDGGASDYYI